MGRTDYERIEADAERRRGLRREELIVEVTEALAEAIDRSGVPRAEVARRLGKGRAFVTQVLAGGRNLTLGTLAELADAIGCAVKVRLEPSARAAARLERRAGRSKSGARATAAAR